MPSAQNRILVRLLIIVLLFGQFSGLAANAASSSSTPYKGSPKDASVLGREAQDFGKTLASPTVSVSGNSLDLGMKDSSNNLKSILDKPFSYTELSGKPVSAQTTTDDKQTIWNDGNSMDAEGGKRQNELYEDASKVNPTSLEGAAYKVVMDARSAPKPDMKNEAMFNGTREVRANIDDIAKTFADCSNTYTYSDVEKSTKLKEARSCTKIHDKSESCKINHNFTIELITPISGDVQADHPSNDTIVINLGKVGDDYLKSGNKCSEYSGSSTWRVDNPDAIISARVTRLFVDDYMRFNVNGSTVAQAPMSKAASHPSGPSAKKCELKTTWDENPNTDITSLLKGTPKGTNITFSYQALVGGEGEAAASVTIQYDRTKIVKKESYTPDSCIDHWNSAKNGFAKITYECLDSIDPIKLEKGEYKGNENLGSSSSSVGNDLCESKEYDFTCPSDSTNPWTLAADSTCYRNEIESAPPTIQDIKGCASADQTYNKLTGLCEIKDNLVTLDYSPIAKVTCPDGWIFDSSNNTCSADVLKSKLSLGAEKKGCIDSSYTYDPDTDSCYQVGYDPKTYQSTDIYKCPEDSTNPWTLKGTQCTRLLSSTVAPYDNSYYSCADKSFKYDAGLHICKKESFNHQPYPVTPTYSCPVDSTNPWTLKGSKCERSVLDTKPPYANGSCPTLYTLDSSSTPICTRTITQTSFATSTPAELCPADWTDNHTDCEQKTFLTDAPIVIEKPSCPIYFELNTTSTPVCIGKKPESVDAIKVTEFFCGSGEVLDANSKTCVSSSGSTDPLPLVEYKCPVDNVNPWILVGAVCERTLTDTAPPTYTPGVDCPETFYWDINTSKCMKKDVISIPYSSSNSTTCPVDISNPWSYDSANKICTRHLIYSQPAERIIKKGCSDNTYVYNNVTDKCEKDLVDNQAPIPATYSCPVDATNPWTLVGSSCTRSITSTINAKAVPIYSCTEGYTLVDNTCFKSNVDTIPAIENKFCPTGFIKSGSNCIKVAATTNYVDSMSCPSGFTLVAGNSTTCYLSSTVAAQITYGCPAGFTLAGNLCSKSSSENKPAQENYNCPVDYLWNGTTCAKTTLNNSPAEEVFVCPAGFTPSGSGPSTTCSKTNTTAATPNCNNGFTFNGTSCEKSTFSDPQKRAIFCPATALVDGQNFISTGVSLDAMCAMTNSDTCNVEDTSCTQKTNVLPTQTAGFYGSASGLTLPNQKTYDSTFVFLPAVCPQDYVYFGEANQSTQWVAGTCKKPETQTPVYSCGSGWSPFGNLCTQTITSTPNKTYSCASSGWTLSGKLCHETTTETAAYTTSYSCEIGWTKSGTTCTYNSNSSFNAGITYSCPQGVLNGSNCLITDTKPASEANLCPFMYSNGASCTKNNAEPATVSSYTCPNGYTLAGSNCSKSETVTTSPTVTYTCPNTFTLIGSTCSKDTTSSQGATPVYSCPETYTLAGAICSKTTTNLKPANVEYKCQIGYSLQGTTCTKATTLTEPANFQYACPNGYTLAGSSCSKNIILSNPATPNYSCPNGYTPIGSGSSMQCKIVSSPIAASTNLTCNNGWEFDPINPSQCRQAYNVYENPYRTNYNCQTVNPFLGLYGTLNGVHNTNACRYWVIPPGPQPYWDDYPIYSKTSTEFACPGGLSCFLATAEVWSAKPCNSGFTYTGGVYYASNTCQKTAYNYTGANINYYCPNSWALNGTTCTLTTTIGNTVTYSCPDTSWALAGSTCSKPGIDVIPASSGYVCTDATWSLNGSTCSKPGTDTMAADVVYNCDSGWTLNINMCSQGATDIIPANVNYSCPVDYSLEGMTCNKTTTQLQPATANTSCPNTYTLSTDQTVCSLLTTDVIAATPVYSCSSGYLSGDTCVSVQTQNSDVTKTCPNGWTDTGSGCKNGSDDVQPESTDYTCPYGYIYAGSGFCSKTTTDSTPASSFTSVYACDIGFTLDTSQLPNTCSKTDSQIMSAFQLTAASCPVDYTLDGAVCTKVTKLIAPAIVLSDKWECNQGFYTLDINTNMCIYDTGLEQIPSGTSSSVYCPAGYADSGYNCQMEVYYFSSVIPIPEKYECPVFFTLDSAQQTPVCLKLTNENMPSSISILDSCPVGWVNTGNKCYLGVPPVKPADSLGMSYTCDAGWILDTSGEKPQCTLIEHKVRDAIYLEENTCPVDWIDANTRCEQYNLVKIPAIILENQKLCSQGYILNGENCEKQVKKNQPAVRECKPSASSASSEASENSFFNALTKTSFAQSAAPKAHALQVTSHSSSSKSTVINSAQAKQPTAKQAQLAHFISKVTDTPPLGGDGTDNCVLDGASGVYVCESNFGSSPLPPDAKISPFCKVIDVTADYDYYKGKFSYTDVNGNLVEAESGLNNDDTCDALEKDSSCSYRTTRCIDGYQDADGKCYLEEYVYDCGETITYKDVDAKKDMSCTGTVRCMGSDCFDPNEEKSDSFQKAASMMQAAEMMATDMTCDASATDMSGCKIFAGKKYECKIAVGGAQDCCDMPTGLSALDYVQGIMAMYKANKALMAVKGGSATGVVGGYQHMSKGVTKAFSSVTEPFASNIENVTGAVKNFTAPVTDVVNQTVQQIKDYIANSIDALFEKISGDLVASGAATTGGAVATEPAKDQAKQEVTKKVSEQIAGAANVLMTAYTAYVVTMMVIQTIYKCEQEEFELAPKRDTKNCTYIGQRKVSLLEKKQVYCCFNSPLSRIINEQASVQLGTKLEDQNPKSPDCSGISVSQMQNLNWEAMDLSEWTAMLQKFNLGPQMNAAEMNMDKLTGSGTIYNQMFPDSQRSNAVDRTSQRMEDIDLDEMKQEAKDQAPFKVDGCVNCK